MKGLALAQQADVQLVAGVPFNALGQELEGIVACQPRQALPESRAHHAQSQHQQLVRAPAGCGNQVKSPADKDLDETVKPVVQDGRQDPGQREKRVAHQMGDDPAHRPGAVVGIFVF